MKNIKLDTLGLDEVAISINNKSERIKSVFYGECLAALRRSNDCINLTNISLNEFYNRMTKIYAELNGRLYRLSKFIDKEVVARYGLVSDILTKKFNNELGTEINGILESINTSNIISDGNTVHIGIPNT